MRLARVKAVSASESTPENAQRTATTTMAKALMRKLPARAPSWTGERYPGERYLGVRRVPRI